MQCQGPNCTREIEQVPGSHRQRIYCSDRCRIAARRQRMRSVEQEQIQQVEARTRKEREKMARRFGLLTEDSLGLLVDMSHRDAKLARLVGQALARERDQALANQTIKVELYLRVENNSKFVRGKGKVHDEIERYILRQYAMEKHPNGVDYTLTIPYETEEQLERIIYQDILQEAASTADARYCFIEADVTALDDSGRHW